LDYFGGTKNIGNCLLCIEFGRRDGDREKREGISGSCCGVGQEDETKREDLWILLYEKGETGWRARGFDRVGELYPPRSIQGA
jgi:hypothetical protein